MTKQGVDFHLYRKGRLVGFRAISPTAEQWLVENVVSEPWQHSGFVLWVEYRFAGDLIDALSQEGLMVKLEPVL